MNDKTFHHAFSKSYNAIVNVLKTYAEIAFPKATNPDQDKKFYTFQAIWDTGATNSVITKNVVEKVGLKPSGRVECHGVHGTSTVDTYIVDIVLPNRVCIVNVQVSECNLLSGIDVLIGMDIIQTGDFAISNGNGKMTFSFCIPPHKNPIDLVEKSERVNPKRKK